MTSLPPEPNTPRYERAVAALYGSNGYYDGWTARELVELVDSERAMPHDCEHTWKSLVNKVIMSGEWCPKCGAIRP
jgi:hypothetical protein